LRVLRIRRCESVLYSAAQDENARGSDRCSFRSERHSAATLSSRKVTAALRESETRVGRMSFD